MTKTTERCKEVNYGRTDTNACCWHCEHSRTAHYAPSGTKFVCDELNIQTYKNCTCKLFKFKKNVKERMKVGE